MATFASTASPTKYGSVGTVNMVASCSSLQLMYPTYISPIKAFEPHNWLHIFMKFHLKSGHIPAWSFSIHRSKRSGQVTVSHGLVTAASLYFRVWAFILVTPGHGLVTVQNSQNHAFHCAHVMSHLMNWCLFSVSSLKRAWLYRVTHSPQI